MVTFDFAAYTFTIDHAQLEVDDSVGGEVAATLELGATNTFDVSNSALIGNGTDDTLVGMGRVEEFQDEGNNVTARALPIILATPPDLRVTNVTIPQHAVAGQFFDLSYTVSNTGAGPTPPRQDEWDDLVYLSVDPFLDLERDRYLVVKSHRGSLAAGASHTSIASGVGCSSTAHFFFEK